MKTSLWKEGKAVDLRATHSKEQHTEKCNTQKRAKSNTQKSATNRKEQRAAHRKAWHFCADLTTKTMWLFEQWPPYFIYYTWNHPQGKHLIKRMNILLNGKWPCLFCKSILFILICNVEMIKGWHILPRAFGIYWDYKYIVLLQWFWNILRKIPL